MSHGCCGAVITQPCSRLYDFPCLEEGREKQFEGALLKYTWKYYYIFSFLRERVLPWLWLEPGSNLSTLLLDYALLIVQLEDPKLNDLQFIKLHCCDELFQHTKHILGNFVFYNSQANLLSRFTDNLFLLLITPFHFSTDE